MLNQNQQEVVTGSLLGDACIWTNFQTTNMKFQKSQSERDHKGHDKSSYMEWHESILRDFKPVTRPGKYKGVSGKTYHKYTLTTSLNPIWNSVEDKWYVPRTDHPRFKRRKIVPNDIKLTPLTLCVWHMDDGSNNAKDANIELNTQGFTKDEVEFLIEKLDENLGIKSKKKVGRKKDDDQFKIFVGRKSYFDFIDMIKPHVAWDCFKYKIDTSGYTKEPQIGEKHSQAKLTEKKAKRIFEMRKSGMLQKEIAKKMKVSKATISLILSGDHWPHLKLSLPTKRKPRITKEKKQMIVELSNQGYSQKDIAKKLDVNQSTVSRTVNS